jgi:hypothetical protein
MSLTMLPGRISCLKDEEFLLMILQCFLRGCPTWRPRREEEFLLMNLTMLPERISGLEAEVGGGVLLDRHHKASWEDILPGG